MILERIANKLDSLSSSIQSVPSEPSTIFESTFPDIISRSRESKIFVSKIPFTYFSPFPVPIRYEEINVVSQESIVVSTIEFLESFHNIVPPSLNGDDILEYAESLFEKYFSPQIASGGGTNFTIIRILFFTCVLGAIKLTSETSCYGLISKATEFVLIGSVDQPRFKLQSAELSRIEAWFVCEFLFNSV